MTKLLRREHGRGRTEPARLLRVGGGVSGGPGRKRSPRNVLLQFSDGARVVKTSAAWRYARQVAS
jgi:hypothetical protein